MPKGRGQPKERQKPRDRKTKGTHPPPFNAAKDDPLEGLQAGKPCLYGGRIKGPR